MVVWYRIKTKRKLLIHPVHQDHTHFSPHCITDHKAGSIHFDILFKCVQMCPTGEVVRQSTCGVPHLKSATASLDCSCAFQGYSDMV